MIDDQRRFFATVERHAFHPRMTLKLASYSSERDSGSRITVIGGVVNLVLAAFKAAAGVHGHSAAMVADAVHSFSDLISDFLTLIALQLSSLPPDRDHPYGHGRFEPLGSLAIGAFLLIASATFMSSAFEALAAPEEGPPGYVALVAAFVSVLSKEALFRATVVVGEQLSSQVVIANAWHHRSDALSSVVAIFGIGGALISPRLRILDPLCGIAVAALVGWMGLQILFQSLGQLADTTDEDAIELIAQAADAAAAAHPEVLGVDSVRCRWMSSACLVADLRLRVKPALSVARAHALGERVHAAVQKTMPALSELLISTVPSTCPSLPPGSPAIASPTKW